MPSEIVSLVGMEIDFEHETNFVKLILAFLFYFLILSIVNFEFHFVRKAKKSDFVFSCVITLCDGQFDGAGDFSLVSQNSGKFRWLKSTPELQNEARRAWRLGFGEYAETPENWNRPRAYLGKVGNWN